MQGGSMHQLGGLLLRRAAWRRGRLWVGIGEFPQQSAARVRDAGQTLIPFWDAVSVVACQAMTTPGSGDSAARAVNAFNLEKEELPCSDSGC